MSEKQTPVVDIKDLINNGKTLKDNLTIITTHDIKIGSATMAPAQVDINHYAKDDDDKISLLSVFKNWVANDDSGVSKQKASDAYNDLCGKIDDALLELGDDCILPSISIRRDGNSALATLIRRALKMAFKAKLSNTVIVRWLNSLGYKTTTQTLASQLYGYIVEESALQLINNIGKIELTAKGLKIPNIKNVIAYEFFCIPSLVGGASSSLSSVTVDLEALDCNF